MDAPTLLGYSFTKERMTNKAFDTRLKDYIQAEICTHIAELKKGMYIHKKNKPNSKGTEFIVKRIDSRQHCDEVLKDINKTMQNFLDNFDIEDRLRKSIVAYMGEISKTLE